MPLRTKKAMNSLKTPPGVGISELLTAVVRNHYDPIEDPKGCDGAQMWNGQWWMPLWGCDTLDHMLDDMAYAIERQQAAAHGSAALDYDAWEKQGGDTDGITRTVCHYCDRMWPMAAMTEDSRFDNICPICMTERQNAEVSDGGHK